MKTLTSMKFHTLLIISFMFLTSCEDDDPCEDCQSAINHMCEQIRDNGCNPDWMENAANRIREDCGTSVGNDYIGFMQHTCAFESELFCPECIEINGNIFADLEVENVDYTLIVNLPDSNYVFRLQNVDENGNTLIATPLIGKKLNVVSSAIQKNNRQMYLTLEHHELDPENSTVNVTVVADHIEIFDVYRPGRWFNPRTIRFNYEPLTEQHFIEVVVW